MSYEQKYIKYKHKYQELKQKLSNTHEMQSNVEIHDFILTDTPTIGHLGGGAVDVMPQDTATYYDLTDTPEQSGGMTNLMPAPFGPTVPLTTCPGMVNPMPDVSSMIASTPVVPLSPVPAIPSAAQVAGADEIASDEFNTTTNVSEIQNTEDIERLFSQFGGKRGKSSKRNVNSEHSDSKRKSSSSSESSASSSMSEFDDSLTVSDF